MKIELRGHWPLAAALIVLWAGIAGLLGLALKRTHGHLVYALDDTYIHMAIAKHLARDGVWRVTPYAFGSWSSSPLWTSAPRACLPHRRHERSCASGSQP